MLIAIITAWIAYTKAKESGRNGWLWGMVAVAVFIGTQYLTAIVIGIVLGLLVAFGKADERIFDDANLVVSAIAIAASLFASWLLFKYLDRPNFMTEELGGPPPPPVFGGSLSLGSDEPREAAQQPKPEGSDLPQNRD